MCKQANLSVGLGMAIVCAVLAGVSATGNRDVRAADLGAERTTDHSEVLRRLVHRASQPDLPHPALRGVVRSLLLGEYHQAAQQPQAALRNLEAAERQYQRAAREPKVAACPDCQTALALVHLYRGLALRDLGRSAESVASFDRAADLFEQLATRPTPTDAQGLQALARLARSRVDA
jgi:tetratricopeptide (TPR) repeat protein